MQLRPILDKEVRVLTLGLLILMFLFIAPIRAFRSYSTSWLSQKFGPAVTFNVTNTNDSGVGSLRQAIIDANATPGTDTIGFNIPGSPPHSIPLLSPLPPINDSAIIDGTTQTGFSGVPIIELNGSGAGAGADGLNIPGGGSTIKALVINRFSGNGIVLSTKAENSVQGCYIGTSVNGLAAQGNSGSGIRVVDSGTNTIGGITTSARNLISGNGDYGIRIVSGSNNSVQGNFIGTNVNGNLALFNNTGGVSLASPNNTIGGTVAGARNVITGNFNYGVSINGGSASGNSIQGNYIGTDVNGTASLGSFIGVYLQDAPNNVVGGTIAGARNVISSNSYGVYVTGSIASGNFIQGNYIGTNASGTGPLGNSTGIQIYFAPGNTVGGNEPTARNLISGNNYGVIISGSSSSGNSIQGNFIGTDANGTGDLGNSASGVLISDAPNNTIGGTTAGARNIISGNNISGVLVSGSLASGNSIQGNYIGTNANGTGALGNSAHGVEIQFGMNNTVGAVFAGVGNLISNNGQAGVAVVFGGTGNSIRGNSIFSNGGLGIDLGNNGVTANDAGDGDSGPNDFQNFPVLTSVTSAGGTTTISGSLNSAPSSGYAIDLFSSTTVDDSTYGEGQVLLGSTNVTTNAGGNATFSFDVSPEIPIGTYISATATGTTSGFSTSEFSRSSNVGNTGPMPVTNINNSGPGSLRQAIIDANLHLGLDTVTFSIPGPGPFSIALLSTLPVIDEPIVIDATTQPGFSGLPVVELNGMNAGSGVSGLTITGGSSTIKGLVINRFSNGSGIRLSGSGGNMIQGNFLGTNLTGVSAAGNNIGIRVENSGNVIGGTTGAARNLISSNSYGVYLSGSNASGNSIQGNYVGTDVSGTASLGNFYGVYVQDAPNSIIGGTTTGARNVISGNNNYGVYVTGITASGNSIKGNYIGTSVNGTVALGNSTGIQIFAPGNVVGGTDSTARNLISGNNSYGVIISGSSSSGNLIQGNFIGTDANGTGDLGNSVFGVYISDAPNNTIGGTTTGARNIISGNNSSGVYVSGSSASVNSIQGNYIGTNAVGTGAIGNFGHGVEIQFASNNAIGGEVAGAGNLISNNSQAGVAVFSGTGNFIRGNSIFSNVGLGIDLGFNGVTPNDVGDTDTGPNNYQNFPTITSIMPAGADTAIAGSINSIPTTSFTLEFFSSATPDDSLNGEGQMFLGSTSVTTDASGNAGFNFIVSPALPSSVYVSATATRNSAPFDTSEFSRVAVSNSVAPMPVSNVNNSGPGSLRQAIIDANLHPGVDSITFNIPGSAPFSIAPVTALPLIDEPTIVDATTQPGYAGTPIVEINGSSVIGSGLTITAGNSTIKGFVINRFIGSGIVLSTNGNNLIQGNFIGTDVRGTLNRGNSQNGITINESPNNMIGGVALGTRNLISGNSASGVSISGSGANGNSVLGNFIGPDINGLADLGNFQNGVIISGGSSNNVIGAASLSARNLISGNNNSGISISQGSGNVIQGNFIGTDINGVVDLGNSSNGIGIVSSSGNTIGGNTPGTFNVISGNDSSGVSIQNANGNSLQGNFIGTDVNGARDLGNNVNGILFSNSSFNSVGIGTPMPTSTTATSALATAGESAEYGAEPAESSPIIISGNNSAGIFISGGSNNTIQGCIIGTDINRVANIGNSSHGIDINSSNSTVGGIESGAANSIMFNGGSGVLIRSGTGNALQRNSIRFNVALGIDLGFDGVTANDQGDGDTGANNKQNFPVIDQLVSSAGSTTISGTINSNAGTELTLEFFWSEDPDASAFGEGGTYIGSTSVVTDALGNASYNLAVPELPMGVFVSATATRTAAPFDTSEFSRSVLTGNFSPIQVTNTDTAGPGSLAQAIINANFHPGPDAVTFNIAGNPPFLILGTSLPVSTGPITIDATTQPGFAGAPLVEIRRIGTGVTDGLVLAGGSSTVRGLVFTNFLGAGLVLQSAGNTVQGNYFGTTPSGTAVLANTVGIRVESSGNLIGGGLGARNIISGNTDSGVLLFGTAASGNTIQSNFIGTDVTGAVDLGNVVNGIKINGGQNNLIGGITPSAANVISGNNNTGVLVLGISATGNVIQGNLIGTNAAGIGALGNSINGIEVNGASNNSIGGTANGSRNLISGNGRVGVSIFGSSASGNQVLGNYVGTDVNGMADLGNSLYGVEINGAPNNQIGGNVPQAMNVISGNNSAGIQIFGVFSTGNTVAGNFIGTDKNGSGPLPNSAHGVIITAGASINTIGGIAPGQGNVIAFNNVAGITVASSSTSNVFLGNSWFSNGALGIDLGTDGVTPNDAGDADTGANNLQNYPVLSSVTSDGAGTTIEGTLNSTPSTAFTIDFYRSIAGDPTGYGEGQTYLGSTTTNSNGIGVGSFNVSLGSPVPLGSVITAIARNDSTGDSSEFSQAQTVTAPTAITMSSFIATGYDNGVFIEWQTGLEVDNLGFNIYRDEAGKRTLVNQQLVAGSALRDGFAIAAGEAYAWWDNTSSKNAAYWLEDVDLKGTSTWHGPFATTHVGGVPPTRTSAALISKIGNQPSNEDSTRVVESVPSVSARSADQGHTQSLLASETAVKIAVKREGWYRVTQPELVAAGLDPKVDSRLLQLFVEGRELPIYVATGKDGSFDESSAIEFYGVGLDTPSADTRIYWLTIGDKDGKRIAQTKAVGAPSSAQSFTQTVERRDRTIYFSALLNGEKENFFGSVIAGTGVEQMLTLNQLAPSDTSNLEATLEVALQGVTITAHRVLVQLNGVAVGEISFNGHQQGLSQFNIRHSLLREGANTVRLIPQSGSSDISLVDHIRVSYQHPFTADDNSLKLAATGGERIAIDGFTENGIRVFDVTDTGDVQELIGEVTKSKLGFAVSVTPQERGLRTLIAVADDKSRRTTSVKANKSSSWRGPGNVADLVVITTGEMTAAIEPLKAARQSEGYKVAVVDVEDIYDEFNFGHKSPQAIKDFLAFAVANWKIAPRFVLLAGDASFDANNYLGLGDNDLVPTRLIDTVYLETASDDWFADFNNDAVSDLAIGRLPFRSVEEAAAVISKLIRYSRSNPSNSVTLISDANDGFNFEKVSEQLRPLFPPSLRVEEIRRGELDPLTARAQLLDSIGRGDKLINYVGHGSANQWRGGLLTAADAAALKNEDRLPMFVMMTCLNGYFHDATFDSLAESLLKAGHGGAVAAWASSGMTLPDQQAVINQHLYRLLFADSIGKATTALTLGEATQRAKTAVGDADVRRTWILLGDPTMRLR